MHLIESPSPNHDDRPAGQAVDTLVLHYTGMKTGEAALERLRDPAAKVSSHWLVMEDGTVHRLVSEERRAWHAGVSSWRGNSNTNARSVGIEIVNPGHEFGYRPFPPPQMEAVAALCLDILHRHPIPARNVVGHSDVAPLRKEDPGELFDWPGLAAIGIGQWVPRRASQTLAIRPAWLEAQRLLHEIGYGLGQDQKSARAALKAFKRHHCPWTVDRVVDGVLDRETMARLALLAMN